MKKVSLILFATSALIFSNCTQQEIDTPVNQTRVLNAIMEDVDKTKSDATDEGIFTWSANDSIYVHTSTGFRAGTLVGEGGTTSASFTYTLIGDEKETGYAVYPYHESHSIAASEIKVTLPATYKLGSTLRNTNAIMLATPESDATVADDTQTNSYKFNHLAGVMRFKFKNVPAGVNRFELSLGGAKLNGEFAVADGMITTVETETASEKTTALTFDALKVKSDIVLFVPIPVGTYTGATLAFYAGETKVWSFESTKTNTVARKNLVRMPEVKISSSEGTIVTYVDDAATLKAAVAAGGEILLTADVALTEILTINKNVVLNGNGKTLTSTASRAINVETDGIVTIKDLTINAGERAVNIINKPATVNLTNVTATASNNAVMVATSAEDVKLNVTNCDFTGLAVINVAGPRAVATITDTKITNVDANPNEAYGAITVWTSAAGAKVTVNGGEIITSDDSIKAWIFPADATVEGVDEVGYINYLVGDAGFDDFDEAVEEVKNGGTIKLARNVSASEILTIDKNIVLDGNGKTLTSTASRAINVSGATDVTIKNLTIEASGERAINVIQNTKKVTIDNVIATAANYTVNVASSAPGAEVYIDNSTLSGLCTVNVSSPSTEVTVENSTINCNDNNTTVGEAYAAISLNKDAIGGKITAKNTVVNVTEGSDSYKGRNGAENGEVTINGSTKDVVVMVAALIYPNNDYYHAFASLDGAIQFDEVDKGVVTLIRDITLAETITIAKGKTVVLDLNGKTISQEKECTDNYSMITNNGALRIMDSSNGLGKISFKDTGAGDPSFGWGSYTIRNNGGNLTIDNAKIEHLGEQDFATHMICAVYQYSGSTTINGGVISTPYYRSARLWKGDMTINGGTFDGQLWVQSVDDSAELIISGGEFSPNGRDGSSVFVGNVTNNGVHHTVEFNVTGGYFETKIGCNDASKVTGERITGGVFTEAAKSNTPGDLIAEGYGFVQNADGTFTLTQQN